MDRRRQLLAKYSEPAHNPALRGLRSKVAKVILSPGVVSIAGSKVRGESTEDLDIIIVIPEDIEASIRQAVKDVLGDSDVKVTDGRSQANLPLWDLALVPHRPLGLVAARQLEGGPGSGNYGHKGIPGQRGGSLPGGGGGRIPLGSFAGQPERDISGYDEGYMQESQELDSLLREDSGTDYRWADDEPRVALKQKVVAKLTEDTGLPEEDVGAFVKQWSSTSNDEDMRSLAVQRDAASLFGVPLSDYQKAHIASLRTKPDSPGTRPLLSSSQQKLLLKTQYNNTQARLAKAGLKGGDTVLLFRGTKGPYPGDRKWPKRGDIIQVKGNALESWSVNRSVAESFSRHHRMDERGMVMAMRVPIERIVSLASTGMGCLTEGEAIIAGGVTDGVTVAERF